MNDNYVLVSGYFDPVHVGHLDYIHAASKLGKVIVIVNNRSQTVLKKGKEFMPLRERIKIISNLGDVSHAFPSIDTDKSVCTTILRLSDFFNITHFCNGGDWKKNCPEESTCKSLNIKSVYGVGGEKVQSSSDLIAGAK